MLENLYYNSTLSPKIVSNENSSTASNLNPELLIKERLDAVPIDNILPVTGLVSTHILIKHSLVFVFLL